MDKLLLKGKELCIYCRGAYGLRTYFQLRDLGIPVAFFADADKQKWGYVIDGIYCFSYDNLLQRDKERTIVIVCRRNPEDLMRRFCEKKFLHVYSYEIIAGMVQESPAIPLDTATIKMVNTFRKNLNELLTAREAAVPCAGTGDAFAAALEQVLKDAKDRGRYRCEDC